MSTESPELEGVSASSKPKPRPPMPDILRHQHSFEQRYSSIIQKQIWETSINKEVLERQLNAYFPFARSASLQNEGQSGFDVMVSNCVKTLGKEPKNIGQKVRGTKSSPEKGFERLDTLDIAEKCEAETQTSSVK